MSKRLAWGLLGVVALAAGCKADFSLVDMSHPYMQPAHEPVRSLIYSASDRAIRHVYVDGTQVVKDGKVLQLNIEDTPGKAETSGAATLLKQL